MYIYISQLGAFFEPCYLMQGGTHNWKEKHHTVNVFFKPLHNILLTIYSCEHVRKDRQVKYSCIYQTPQSPMTQSNQSQIQTKRGAQWNFFMRFCTLLLSGTPEVALHTFLHPHIPTSMTETCLSRHINVCWAIVHTKNSTLSKIQLEMSYLNFN